MHSTGARAAAEPGTECRRHRRRLRSRSVHGWTTPEHRPRGVNPRYRCPRRDLGCHSSLRERCLETAYPNFHIHLHDFNHPSRGDSCVWRPVFVLRRLCWVCRARKVSARGGPGQWKWLSPERP